MLGAIGGLIGGIAGGLFGGGGGGGNDAVGAASAAMDRALATQAQMLAIQTEYQEKKAVLDTVANILNSEHQANEQYAQRLGQS